MAVAGAIIASGGLGQAINIFRLHGGGAAGWAAAGAWLHETYPGSHGNSINAVLSYAQRAFAVSSRYQNAGPNYTAPVSAIPDVRRLLSDAGVPFPVGSETGRGRCFRHIYGVETFLTDKPNVIVSNSTYEAGIGPLLTNSALQADMARYLMDDFRNFLDTLPGGNSDDRMRTRVRLVGIYATYC